MVSILGTLLLTSAPCAFAHLEFASVRETLSAKIEEEQRTVAFRFRNAGTQPVKILRIQNNCDCTTASSDQSTYLAGQEGVITVVFHFGEREGTQYRTLRVETDEPGESGYLLAIQAELPRLAIIEPAVLYWRPADLHSTKTIRIQLNPAQGLTFLGAMEESKAFIVTEATPEAPRTNGSLDERMLQVRLNATSLEADLHRHLLLHFATPKGRVITYRVALRATLSR